MSLYSLKLNQQFNYTNIIRCISLFYVPQFYIVYSTKIFLIFADAYLCKEHAIG